ncbi:hypothetical protein [Rhodococcus sp. WY5]|uniref:hypothetical protein n=1 Tax=Rhodococcus sp. WY5 TaxID=2708349 RepID=UPI001BDEE319|nr:hypothetical protein [Rhodococcus sp. WY5]
MTDTTAICAKIIRRYATLREEYLHGKSDADFNSSSTTDQERWLMCEISGLRKAADLLSADASEVPMGLPSRYWDAWPEMVEEIRSSPVENEARSQGVTSTAVAPGVDMNQREMFSQCVPSCDACGTDAPHREVPSDGWTQSHGEKYCPSCSFVRQQSWGTSTHHQVNEAES